MSPAPLRRHVNLVSARPGRKSTAAPTWPAFNLRRARAKLCGPFEPSRVGLSRFGLDEAGWAKESEKERERERKRRVGGGLGGPATQWSANKGRAQTNGAQLARRRSSVSLSLSLFLPLGDFSPLLVSRCARAGGRASERATEPADRLAGWLAGGQRGAINKGRTNKWPDYSTSSLRRKCAGVAFVCRAAAASRARGGKRAGRLAARRAGGGLEGGGGGEFAE